MAIVIKIPYKCKIDLYVLNVLQRLVYFSNWQNYMDIRIIFIAQC